MGSVGWYLLITALIAIPFWRLLPKFGISKYFALMTVVPAMAIILLWMMAFKDQIEDPKP